MSAKEKIEELALRVAEDALDSSATPEDRREALKILNAHYTMLLKSKAKSEDEPDSGFTFDHAQETLNGGSSKAVGSHQRA
jgi:hypothetical protein